MLLERASRGVAATAVMSLSFLARPDLAPPPRVVSRNVARRAGVDVDELPGAVEHPYWVAAHVGFGVTLALAHALLRRPKRGVAFGMAAWVANYGIALPALGLYPRIDRDDRVRGAAGLLAHVVYGSLLGRAS